MTIRRDIHYIETNHLLEPESKHDESTMMSPFAYEFSKAQLSHAKAKEKIGKYAATLIEPNDVILLDTGTTVNYVAESLPNNIPLTIICYNANVLHYLTRKTNISLILAGGYYHFGSMSFESTENLELLRRLRATKMFVSTSGVERVGLTCSNQYEVLTKKTAIDSSVRKILLADSGKFGVVRSSLFAKLSDMDAVISDEKLPEDWRNYLQDQGLEVTIV